MSDETLDPMPEQAGDILRFWFGELEPEQWWKRDERVDKAVRERFLAMHEMLAESVSSQWLATAHSRLAAILALDQFPRNLFRGSARSFATDAAALGLAKETVSLGLDETLNADERIFLYVPFQHSENPSDQSQSVALYEKLGNPDTLDFARKHRLVIDRFGRFPHRNGMLGRETTEEERAFLERESWFW